MSADPAAHLHVYRFDPDVAFEGRLVGALGQLEVAADVALLDAIFVTHDAATGRLQAVDLATGRADGTIAALLDFRLDEGARSETTRRTLAAHPGGVPAAVVEAVAEALEPGGAMLAVLVAGGAPAALDDAVARIGGRPIADEPVAASTLADVATRLRGLSG
jgi:hypothetical protein